MGKEACSWSRAQLRKASRPVIRYRKTEVAGQGIPEALNAGWWAEDCVLGEGIVNPGDGRGVQ